ncbi:MAG: hypothetical protein ACRCZI_11460 [Cetobacterium sp.]
MVINKIDIGEEWKRGDPAFGRNVADHCKYRIALWHWGKSGTPYVWELALIDNAGTIQKWDHQPSKDELEEAVQLWLLTR